MTENQLDDKGRMNTMKYAPEELDDEEDDGTMPDNVASLADKVVGHRIVTAQIEQVERATYGGRMVTESAFVITLDDGTKVELHDDDDCCAYTSLDTFLLHPDKVDHIITGVGTTERFTKWHIYADMGDVLELEVGWSCGNPFYYGYGFDIRVVPLEATA